MFSVSVCPLLLRDLRKGHQKRKKQKQNSFNPDNVSFFKYSLVIIVMISDILFYMRVCVRTLCYHECCKIMKIQYKLIKYKKVTSFNNIYAMVRSCKLLFRDSPYHHISWSGSLILWAHSTVISNDDSARSPRSTANKIVQAREDMCKHTTSPLSSGLA